MYLYPCIYQRTNFSFCVKGLKRESIKTISYNKLTDTRCIQYVMHTWPRVSCYDMCSAGNQNRILCLFRLGEWYQGYEMSVTIQNAKIPTLIHMSTWIPFIIQLFSIENMVNMPYDRTGVSSLHKKKSSWQMRVMSRQFIGQ